ncbi:uncharacterized protein A1O9_10363 [Exophiala aquamarina CBS 119918]|uniref:Uncharacterized protein n=1 Tax=Exophiala aquamarina CBS 119918 TaxID=1182545 RepID=A0A072P288_9EURO|nr:uncharacterized protein A1O9_10363 [Exophiala aquamarina CBS 119918]KEF53388.1 hypothetical protein A1O9_10363 [Exophiala aquamarina CBS 119918]
MSGKYSVEDLLKLRASPLICKPPNLPPMEEWMGPATRSKLDDQALSSEAFQKRPTLEGQRRIATDPDRIVLGPPRRSFASSNARTAGKILDLTEDKSKTGDTSESRTQERRNTQTNGRHNRHESDDQGLDSRRDYDRKLRWGREKNEQQDLEEDQMLEESRPGFRRDTISRAKMSQSWFRKDTAEALEETRRDSEKTPEWRTRARDRDWDRSTKLEADPEWMDSTEPEEPFQAHTQEDFQRWKEKMKAGGTPQEQPETTITDSPGGIVEEKATQKLPSLEPDDSMDKFFARYEQKTVSQKPGPSKAGTKTRFASLFSPAAEQGKPFENTAPVATERPSSAQMPGNSMDADQAGFARILEMLQTRSNNPTPQTQTQTQEQPKPRTPLYARDSQAKMEGEPRPHSSSNLLSFLGNQNAGYPPEGMTGPAAPPLERYPDTKSPVEQPSHTRQQSSINKDEVLLNLLRQANLAPKPQPPPMHQHAELRSASHMYGVPDPNPRQALPRSQGIPLGQAPDPGMNQRRDTGRSMFDELPVPMYHNEQGPREHLPRRPTNGSQLSYNEDPLMALLRSQTQGQQRMMQSGQPQSVPPGLQRPPGLDQMPRPNPSWPPQQPQSQPQPQQQPPRQPPLPPGLANMPRGMPGAPYGQPQPLPNQPNIPPQQQPQRPLPQRKYTGESASAAGIPNFPPGMGPPPGFMNAGPPPGFPGAPGANYPARFQGEPPQGVRGGFMEMYGDMGGRGVGLRGGGANGGMPGYR